LGQPLLVHPERACTGTQDRWIIAGWGSPIWRLFTWPVTWRVTDQDDIWHPGTTPRLNPNLGQGGGDLRCRGH
jgi:hypothetical protein